MKQFWKKRLVPLTVILTMLFATPLALAANGVQGGNGLKVSPVRTDLTIDPGTSKIVTVYVENVTDLPAHLQAVVNDFTAGTDESGEPLPILSDSQRAPAHSLKQFAQPLPDFKLAPHQQKTIKVKLSVPKGTPGGGYYGLVRFITAGLDGSNQNVSVAASVGSLIILKVPGDLDENLTIASFGVYQGDVTNKGNAGWLFTNGHDLSAVVRFQNNGNIQEAPLGKIILKKGDKIIETKSVNDTDPPGEVLPDSIRRFSVSLDKVDSWGKYTVQGFFGYGSGSPALTVSKTFYVVPMALIIAVAVFIILIIIGIILGRKELQRHDRKLLSRTRGQSGRSKKRRR